MGLIERRMTFGKYKGKTIIEVIKDHPTYIEWCLTNINWFSLNKYEETCYKKAIDTYYTRQYERIINS